jgi:hypothetical protein
MAYWILQANPNSDNGYRIFDALADVGAIHSWRVARYRHDIAPGDEFALWASGQKSGVYAFGVVTEPAECRVADAGPYWKNPAEANRLSWQVGIRIDEVLLDNPILRGELSRNPDFASALILRMPGGGNPFPVTEVQWQAILSYRVATTSRQGRLGRNRPCPRDAESQIVQDSRKQFLSRRFIIWLAVIVSQIVVIGGLLAWGAALGASATQAPPRTPSAAITVWVTDPRWQIAPELHVSQGIWTIDLSSPLEKGIKRYQTIHPHIEAIVALWGAAQLTDPQRFGEAPFSPGSYRQVQVPFEEFVEKVDSYYNLPVVARSPKVPSLIPAQVFLVHQQGFYQGFEEPLPLVGKVSASMYARTSTGWSAYVPPMGVLAPGHCAQTRGGLPPTVAKAFAVKQRPWYTATCPMPSPIVELRLDEGEHFADSSRAPTLMARYPRWTDQRESTHLPGYIGGFWIDVGDSAIAAAAQRNLLFSGVIFGIAGALLATWLVAGVTSVVKRIAVPTTGDQESGPLKPAERHSDAAKD